MNNKKFFYSPPAAKWYETILAKLFGKKVVLYDKGTFKDFTVYITAYKFRNKLYITGERIINE